MIKMKMLTHKPAQPKSFHGVGSVSDLRRVMLARAADA